MKTPKYRRLNRGQTMRLAAWLQGNRERCQQSDWSRDDFEAKIQQELGFPVGWYTIRSVAREMGIALKPTVQGGRQWLTASKAKDVVLALCMHIRQISEELELDVPEAILGYIEHYSSEPIDKDS